MAIHTLFRAFKSRKQWSSILHFRKLIGCTDNKVMYLFKFFLRISTDGLLGGLLCEAPKKYLSHIYIEGAEHVKKIAYLNRGVLVIGSHGGPSMLQSFLFTNKFGIPLGSYATRHGYNQIKEKQPLLKKDWILQSMPIYSRGQEKKLLKGLLQGEWVNMLIDVQLGSPYPRNCHFAGCPIALSEFPFRISLKYNIPLLFTGIVRPRHSDRVIVRIQPLEGFVKPVEGLQLYVKNLEKLLRIDPYSNSRLPRCFGNK